MGWRMRRLYFALDLKDDPALIAEYEQWHSSGKVWPEVVQSLDAAGVLDLEIFRCGNRLTMVVELPDSEDGASDAALPRIAAWEELMWKFQQRLPFASEGEKWVAMQRIFSLQQTLSDREREA
jgi:L-rhamnose mutarotase